jgi:hypothetical protein
MDEGQIENQVCILVPSLSLTHVAILVLVD